MEPFPVYRTRIFDDFQNVASEARFSCPGCDRRHALYREESHGVVWCPCGLILRVEEHSGVILTPDSLCHVDPPEVLFCCFQCRGFFRKFLSETKPTLSQFSDDEETWEWVSILVELCPTCSGNVRRPVS